MLAIYPKTSNLTMVEMRRRIASTIECKLHPSKRQTAFGGLCALGHLLAREGVLKPFSGVKIDQKTVVHSPAEKLTEALMGMLSKSRDVGAYLGLVPNTDQSGDSDPQKRISKRGNQMLRKFLVSSAHYALGPFGSDSDLRRHGEKIASRGGKNAKSRAVVAVARKLSVLLHRLWSTAEVYEPLYNANRTGGEAT
jgi:Transposase IS116/IS110/IS902 family